MHTAVQPLPVCDPQKHYTVLHSTQLCPCCNQDIGQHADKPGEERSSITGRCDNWDWAPSHSQTAESMMLKSMNISCWVLLSSHPPSPPHPVTHLMQQVTHREAQQLAGREGGIRPPPACACILPGRIHDDQVVLVVNPCSSTPSHTPSTNVFAHVWYMCMESSPVGCYQH
jgi:hypothetical protein